jgi:DNA-binding transcriptional LysR family regulator
VSTAVRQAVTGHAGELRIGFLNSIANHLMPPVVRALRAPTSRPHAAGPGADIATLVEGLRSGTLDAALTRPPLLDDLHTEIVISEPVAVALAADHRLANRQQLSLSRLSGLFLRAAFCWTVPLSPVSPTFARHRMSANATECRAMPVFSGAPRARSGHNQPLGSALAAA